MSEQQLHVRGSASALHAPSIVQRIAGSQLTNQPVARDASRLWIGAVLIVIAVGAAAAWTYLARSQLNRALVDETAQQLISARKAFDALRSHTQANLTAHCRVLVEDPRLKATLATEGMDPGTVADILQDLAKLRRTGFLLALTPDGRVFAQAGASELEGLDLSASSVVKAARDADDASVGSWVLAGKVMDLSIKSVRYDEGLVAFLVVGQPVDEALLSAVDKQTGVAIASALATKLTMSSTADPIVSDVLGRVVGEAASAPHVVTSSGQRFIASVVELPETAQAHRLVLATSLDTVAQRFRVFEWLVFVPPVLVLLALLFALLALRSPRRIS